MYDDFEGKNIAVGDEVIIQGSYPMHIGVVTHNTFDHFCYIDKNGISFHCCRSFAMPKKTGRHFNVEEFLKTLE